MKNKIIIFSVMLLLTGLFYSASASAEEVVDGTYRVQVELWHASMDQASMGNAALSQEGELTVKGGKATLKVEFKAMSFAGLTGYLSELNLLTDIEYNASSYPEKYHKTPAKVISSYAVIDEYNSKNSKDSRIAGGKYPKELSFPVELGEEFTWVHIYVPLMGSVGAGDHEARLKVDYSSLVKIEKNTQTITLNKTTYTLAVGKTTAIKATASQGGIITYTSGNKKIVTISKKGVIKGVKKGTATITLTCNGVNKTVKVTVK